MVWLWVAAFVVLDGAVALVGGLLPDHWLIRHRPVMLGFASGALLSAAVLDILPEALAARGWVVIPWLLGGIVVLAAFDHLFQAHGHHKHSVSYALLGSDAVHNFGDGIAIAAAFLTSTHLGIITSLAVLLHELPEELADYAILREQKMPKGRSLWWLALVQMTAGLGAALTLLGASLGSGHAIVLAIAGGTFIYIAVFELLPDVLRGSTTRDRLIALAGLVAGAALIAVA
jgi:zinc and cadmium transporter